MAISPVNEVVRLKNNLEAAGERKRGRHPVFNANMFYPRAIENDLKDITRAELERLFLVNMEAALVGLRDDISDLNAAPVVLSPDFVEKTGLVATRVNEHAGQTYQKQVDMIIGRPYYPPTAQREILEAWHQEFQTLCISAGQDGKKKIAMTVAVAKEKGWNKYQTEAAIRELLPAETKHRAELIARTELGKLNTRCVIATYEQTGVKYYKWLTTIDGRERESHALMNGKICSVENPDVYFDDNPDNPLKPIEHRRTGEMVHLHPGQDFQCRCTMVMWEPEIDSAYEVKEENYAEQKKAEEEAQREAEAQAEAQARAREEAKERKRQEELEKAKAMAAEEAAKNAEISRKLEILQNANARHAARSEAVRNDIITRWNERRRHREIMAAAELRHAKRTAKQAAAIVAEAQERIDLRNELRSLLVELKGIKGVNTASATVALNKAKTKNIKTAIEKMKAYEAEIYALKRLDDPLKVAKKWGLEEAKKVNAAVELKLSMFEGRSLEERKRALEFEIGWVEQHKKYKTWEVAKNAYEKELNIVVTKIAWRDSEEEAALAISSISWSRSVKAKAAINAINEAKAAGDLEAYKKAIKNANELAPKLTKRKTATKTAASVDDRPEYEGQDLSWSRHYENSNLDRNDFTKNLLIEEVLKDQGFMGLPKMVDNDEFKELLKKDHYLATRTYGSDSKGDVQMLTIDARNGLYNGDFYVKCQGNNVHGFGMYFACDPTLGRNAKINVRIWHAYEKNYHYEEFCTLSKSAKIIQEEDIEMEFLKRGLKSAPTQKLKDAFDVAINRYGGNVNLFMRNVKNFKSLDKKELEFIKGGFCFWKKIPDADLMKDPSKIPFHADSDDHGILAAKMGYDALYDNNSHYGVVLNRSKMILLNRQKDTRTTEQIFNQEFGV